jgi:hypothetical protein
VPVIPSAITEEYVFCPHCSRRYSSEVAERHIPKCRNIINRPKPPPNMLQNTIGIPNYASKSQHSSLKQKEFTQSIINEKKQKLNSDLNKINRNGLFQAKTDKKSIYVSKIIKN